MKDLVARLLEPWTLVGYVGQALFFGRFLVQWIVSERRHRSVIPLSFWWLSIGGGMVLFAYALHRQDPVFVLGQTTGLFVYARNLRLLREAPRPA